MSTTAMHEPVVDFLVPEFHGPEQFGKFKIFAVALDAL